MEKRIPGFVGYTVDELGVVRSTTPSIGIIEPKIGRRGNEYRVELKNDAWKVVRPKVSRLVMTTFNPVLQVDNNWISVVYKNGDVADCSLENLEWDFEGYTPPFDPIDPNNINKVTTVPGFSNYGITPEGIVVNLQTQTNLVPGLSSVGYLCCRLTDDSGKSTYVGIHHLMARALLAHPLDVDQLVTNHINGVKTDNRPDNIEWTSYSGNISHAYNSGLRNEIVPVFAYNTRTGQNERFVSIGQAARFFKRNPGNIYCWLHTKNQEKVRDDWLISLSDKWT